MSSVHLQRWIAQKLRLKHVELVSEVYDSRSILKAAKRLNLTQPAVTKALKDIEGTLNLQLFDRTNRGLNPNMYGEIFARHAKIVLSQLRHAAEELEHLRVGYSGHVAVGTLLAASATLLPEAITMLKKQRPGVAITVIDGTYDILLPSLLGSDLDMVVGRFPEARLTTTLTYERFYSEPTVLVVRRGHPLTRKRRVELRDLAEAAWILPLPQTALRRQIEQAFMDANVDFPRNIIESMSVLTNRALLRQSDCIGIMPYHVVLDDVRSKILALVPVKLKSAESPVGAIMRAPGKLAPAANALLECLRIIGSRIDTQGA